MAVPSPDPALVERFRADLEALALEPGTIGVAVSGGPDSLALLLLAAAALPGRIRAATVDHGLRPEAAAEALHVAEICTALGCPHAILKVAVAARGEGLQGEARRARYAALGGWMAAEGIAILLTGHHADDQAETLLMRLLRGSGVAGLAGIRARARLPGGKGEVARPLLGWRHDELAAIVAGAGLEPADDPSNRDEAHDRVRIRRRLAETPWLDAEPLARSAAALAEAEQALASVALRLFAERTKEDESAVTLDPDDLPPELLRRLVLACLREITPDAAPRGEQLTTLIAALHAGGTATLAGVRCSGGPRFRFALAPPRRAS